MAPEDVAARLRQAFPDAEVMVQGSGSHYEIGVVCDSFAGLNKVRRQQRVYAVLQEAFASGSMHAVDAMHTYTREEWDAARRRGLA